jgi:hypothetical protein
MAANDAIHLWVRGVNKLEYLIAPPLLQSKSLFNREINFNIKVIISYHALLPNDLENSAAEV